MRMMVDFSGSHQQILYRVDKSRKSTLNVYEIFKNLSQELCHLLQLNFSHRQTSKYSLGKTISFQHLLQYLITEVDNINSR